jgi:catechol-2,3-dioxygenase
MPEFTVNRSKDPALKCITFLSHGTLESRDLDKARQFYEECLGIETIRTQPVSLMIRLGGNNTIAVVRNPRKAEMPLLGHNGLDVPTRTDVDNAADASAIPSTVRPSCQGCRRSWRTARRAS